MTLEQIRRIRDAALVAAEDERAARLADAQEQYSETIAKLRERFEFETLEALRTFLVASAPAQREYNATVARIEDQYRRAAAQ